MTLLISFFFFLFALRYHREEVRRNYRIQAMVVAPEVEHLLLWEDRVAIRKLLERMLETDKALEYAFVLYPGHPPVSTFPGALPEDLLSHAEHDRALSSPWVFQDSKGRLHLDLGIKLGGGPGSLHLGWNRETSDRELFFLLRTLLFLNLGILCVALFYASRISRRAVVEIEELAKYVKYSEEESISGEWAALRENSELHDIRRSFRTLVSNKRRAEEMILTQNHFLRSIFSALSHPFFVIDTQSFRVLMANNAASESGIKVGDFCYKSTHQQESPCEGRDHPCPLALLREGGAAVCVEHRRIDPKGNPHYYETHGYPIHDEDGQLNRMIGYSIDITARKTAEEHLRRRNRELTLLNWMIAAGASGIPRDELLKDACIELRKTLGTNRVIAALLDEEKNQLRIVAESVVEGLLPILDHVMDLPPEGLFHNVLVKTQPLVSTDVSRDPRFEHIRSLLHSWGIVSVLVVPLMIDHRAAGILGAGSTTPHSFPAEEVNLARSIAAQLSSSLALSKITASRRRLETVIRQMPDIVMISDPAGAILFVNPAFEKLTGYGEEEVVGRNADFLGRGTGDADSGIFAQEVWETVRRGDVWRGRIVNQPRKGEPFTVEATFSPVFGDDGSIENIVAFQRDISREIDLEKQFLQAQKMEVIGRLAGGIAHDFNNLLATIMGNAELAGVMLDAEHPARDLIEEIVKTSDQAARLTRQLLVFSKRGPIENPPICLNTIIRDSGNILRRLIPKNIRIEYDLDPELAPVACDHSRLEQLILNLVVNARDAIAGQGRILISTANVFRSVLPSAIPALGFPKKLRNTFLSLSSRPRSTVAGRVSVYRHVMASSRSAEAVSRSKAVFSRERR